MLFYDNKFAINDGEFVEYKFYHSPRCILFALNPWIVRKKES